MAHLICTRRCHQAGPIRSVWSYNVEEEFKLIRQLARWYPFATIDTEFPGVVYEAPIQPRHMSPQQRYVLVKKNVDRLKLIQLGLTLCSSDSGPGAFITWEFNFRGFNPLRDPHASSSVQLLESQGLDLWKSYYHGIDPHQFPYLMLSSGLLFNPMRIWIGFHMAYDIGYLMKILTGADLPESIETFLDIVRWHFGPRIYDIKHICKSCTGLKGGLEAVAGKLDVQRVVGACHHAGSDSLLTWRTFKKMRATFLINGIEKTQAGVLFGIQDS